MRQGQPEYIQNDIQQKDREIQNHLNKKAKE